MNDYFNVGDSLFWGFVPLSEGLFHCFGRCTGPLFKVTESGSSGGCSNWNEEVC